MFTFSHVVGIKYQYSFHDKFDKDQFRNFAGWVMEGEKQSAAATRKWKSVCGQPLLAMTERRTPEILILHIIVTGNYQGPQINKIF